MDIAILSMALGQSHVQQQATMSVMKMAMGNAEQLQQAAQQHLGGNIDLKV